MLGSDFFLSRLGLDEIRPQYEAFTAHRKHPLCTLVLYCMFTCIVLHCIVLYCIILYSIVLYCIVLYCIVLYCIALYCTV